MADNYYGSGFTAVDSAAGQIQLILFDLGGVLVRLDPSERLNCLVNTFQLDYARTRAFLDSHLPAQFNTGAFSETDFIQRAGIYFDRELEPARFRECWLKLIAGTVPQNLELAGALRDAGYQVGILSNTDPWHWDYIRKLTPLFDRFDPLYTSFGVRLQKPERQLFSAVATERKLQPEQILLIDDTPINLQAAGEAGWQLLCYSDPEQLVELVRMLPECSS